MKIQKSFFFFLFSLFVILFVGIQTAEAKTDENMEKNKEDNLSLTEKEQSYLSTLKSKSLAVGIVTSEATEDAEKYSAYQSRPFITFLEEYLGLSVIVSFGSQEDLKERLKKNELDFIYGLPLTAQEEEIYVSNPVMEETYYFVSNKDYNFDMLWQDGIVIGIIGEETVYDAVSPYLSANTKTIRYGSTNDFMERMELGEAGAGIVSERDLIGFLWKNNIHVISDLPYISTLYGVAISEKVYEPVIDLLNRYIEQNDGEPFLIQVEQEKLNFYKEIFAAENKTIIHTLKKKYNSVVYSAGKAENYPLYYEKDGVISGIYAEMFAYFSFMTDIPFIAYSGDETMEEGLLKNEIQVAAGMAPSNEIKQYSYSAEIYDNELLLAGVFPQIENGKEIPIYFWGTMQHYLPLLTNTILNGHIVGFQAFDKMETAVEESAIRGIILKKSSLDFWKITNKNQDFKVLSEYKIPFRERLFYGSENKKLNALLNQMVHMFMLTYPDYRSKWSSAETLANEKLYQFEVENTAIRQKQIVILVVSGIIVAAGLAVSMFFRERYKKAAQHLKFLEMIHCGDETTPLFDFIEIDMKKEIIKSKKHFSLFDMKGIEKKKVIAFDDIKSKTGFDFEIYYKELSLQLEQSKNSNFLESEFRIFIAGKAVTFREKAAKSGDKILSGLTKLPEKAMQNIQQVEYDALTGLYNKDCYMDKIKEIMDRCPDCYGIFAYLDINNFKKINEIYGHATGDIVLVRFADSLRALVINKNTVVFRVSGDRFGAFRGNINKELDASIFLAELQGLSMGVQVKDTYIKAAYSYGSAIYGQDAFEVKTVAGCAVKALQQARRKGVFSVSFAEEFGEGGGKRAV